MPQALLRSVVYRSFVTCDDPKGVIESGTIRKSKSDPQNMEGKIETQRISKNLNKYSSSSSSSNKRANKETEDMVPNYKGTLQEEKDPSSLQLMEVSRGAQKLNRVIDSWSNGVSFEGQSKDIAKDLLKGALDLQESLMMLGKLQEASQYMAKIKKKEKEKEKEKEKDEFTVERSNSDRFGQNYQAGFRNPSPFGNGSSRDCYEELREMIRDSFARQNLLPNKPYEDKACLDRKKVDSSPDLPSTSSSRSTMAYSHDFASNSDCSFSSKGGIDEKPKCSNLIAKLMGLEEVSSKKTFQSFSQEKLEREKKIVVNQKRPVFDIDMRHMPKARKPHSLVQKEEREKMTLDEIIEMMQFKGLLNSNKPRNRHYSTNSRVEETFSTDSPPIVIMKPWRTSQEVDEIREHRKWKAKQEVPSKIMECRGGALNSIETRRKPRIQEIPAKKNSPEKGTVFKKVVVAKQENKGVKIIKENVSSNMTKNSVVSRAKQEKETIEKKVDKIQKMSPNRKKHVEIENSKSVNVPKIVEQSKQSPVKQRKLESKSNTTRDRISQPKSTSLNLVSQKSSEPKKGLKNAKLVSKSFSSKVEKTEPKGDEIVINLTCESESDPSVTLHTEEDADSFEVLVEEKCDIEHVSRSDDATLPKTQHKSVADSTKEAERNNLILRNPSFFDNSDALFDIYTYECESETADSKLISDCKNEILEHEFRWRIPAVHPLLQNPIARSRLRVDGDKLAAEVRNGIENLKGYAAAADGVTARGKRVPADAVYGVLERDLGCRGGVGGGWGVGWREGYTLGEIDEVVGDIEKIVLSELIEEVVLGFWGLVI